MREKATNMVGEQCGKLTVLSRSEGRTSSRAAFWLCRCACGKEVVVSGASLRGGQTKTCGCSAGQHNITHGMTDSPEHKIWISMRQRCSNPKNRSYKNYGGRGIYVSESWNASFQQFYTDIGPRPSAAHEIDRTDNDGPYSKENCRWVTARENLLNRRNNRHVVIDGVTVCISEAARILGVSHGSVVNRIKKGLPMTKGRLRG